MQKKNKEYNNTKVRGKDGMEGNRMKLRLHGIGAREAKANEMGHG